jgi:hypothetical protein
MQRSSSSIANLAAALAKAQFALVNPEKSLVATIGQSRHHFFVRLAPPSAFLLWLLSTKPSGGPCCLSLAPARSPQGAGRRPFLQ